MTINRIVILVESPFTARDFNRYGIDILKRKNFQIEVWDFTPFLRSSLYQQHKVKKIEDFEECKLFYSRKIALRAIRSLDQESAIISVLNFNLFSRAIYLALSKRNLFYGLLSTNSIPPRFSEEKPIKKISNKFKQTITLQRMLNAIFRRIPLGLLRMRPANFIIAGGAKSLGNAANKYPQLITPSTHKVWAHTMDYDIYLQSQEGEPVNDENIAVFVDQFIPFHPDIRLKSEALDLDVDHYYQALSNFFSRIERELGLKVVIAAHPRANYENLPDYFNGREIIHGKTAQLVKSSKIVLLQFSTAINFAVFYNKPILFVSSKTVEKTYLHDSIRSMATLFSKKPIIIDALQEVSLEKELIVDQDVYNNYREVYIKRKGTPEKLLWEIVSDFLTQ